MAEPGPDRLRKNTGTPLACARGSVTDYVFAPGYRAATARERYSRGRSCKEETGG